MPAKLAIGALPIYTMQVIVIPTKTLKEIERYQRSFIWGHEVIKRKVHTIKLSQICQPKVEGSWGCKTFMI